MTFLLKGKTNGTLREKHCSNLMKVDEKTNQFHITANGRLAINGDLTDDELIKSREDFCVEAIIEEGEKEMFSNSLQYY